jgi:hypothetical protein
MLQVYLDLLDQLVHQAHQVILVRMEIRVRMILITFL